MKTVFVILTLITSIAFAADAPTLSIPDPCSPSTSAQFHMQPDHPPGCDNCPTNSACSVKRHDDTAATPENIKNNLQDNKPSDGAQ